MTCDSNLTRAKMKLRMLSCVRSNKLNNSRKLLGTAPVNNLTHALKAMVYLTNKIC